MKQPNEEIQYILEFYHKKHKNKIQDTKLFFDVYGPNAVSERVAQIVFKCFESENFDVKDALISDRTVTDKIDPIF